MERVSGRGSRLSNFLASAFDSVRRGARDVARLALRQRCELCASVSGVELVCDDCMRDLPWLAGACPVCALPTQCSSVWPMLERPARVRCDDRGMLVRVSDRPAYPFPEIPGPPGAGRMVRRRYPLASRALGRLYRFSAAAPDRVTARRRATTRARLQPVTGDCTHGNPSPSPRAAACPRDSATSGSPVDRARKERSRGVRVRARSFGPRHRGRRRRDDHQRFPRRSGQDLEGRGRGTRRELGRRPNPAAGAFTPPRRVSVSS
jgi:hypothetical protein